MALVPCLAADCALAAIPDMAFIHRLPTDCALATVPNVAFVPCFAANFTLAAVPGMAFVPCPAADRALTAVPGMAFVSRFPAVFAHTPVPVMLSEQALYSYHQDLLSMAQWSSCFCANICTTNIGVYFTSVSPISNAFRHSFRKTVSWRRLFPSGSKNDHSQSVLR